MPYFLELPDGAGVRRYTPRLARVVAGAIREGSLRISDPLTLAGSRPVAEWVEVAGPVRALSEAEYVRLLREAKVDQAYIRAASGLLSPLEQAELEGTSN